MPIMTKLCPCGVKFNTNVVKVTTCRKCRDLEAKKLDTESKTSWKKLIIPIPRKKSPLSEKEIYQLNEQQKNINLAIDSKYKVPLEVKIYRRGTPEFKELARIYDGRC